MNVRLPFLLLLALAMPLCAQQPDTLLHSIPAPPVVGLQVGAQLGYSVAVDETSGLTVAGAPRDDVGERDSGVVKVFDTATGALLHVLVHPSPDSDDQFGGAVAISGTRVVVGAPLAHAGLTNPGRAYVYDLASATPTVPVATLDTPSPQSGDLFGFSVAISGTQVVVGELGHNIGVGANERGNVGIAYVYELVGGGSMLVATLNNPEQWEEDTFGCSVAISGMRVVVGANGNDTGGSSSGIAYVYDLASGTPTVPGVTLSNPSPGDFDKFGAAVGISGTRVAIGAWGDSTGASQAGRAYVYDLAGGTPTVPVATLNNPSPAVNDIFGHAVAISGTRVVVGAYQDNTGASDAGSAYVYDVASGTPTVPVATLNNPSPAVNDLFGYAVAISGTRVVVGAYQDDTGAPNAGSAYVYDAASGTPTVPVATLNNPGLATHEQFGTSVAISGTRMVVGESGDSAGADKAGSVSVYDLASGTPTVPVITLNNPTPAVDDNFGVSVAISGTRLVVGAFRDDTGATDTGSAYVYDLASGTPTLPVATLNNPSPAAKDQFGSSVAISGTRVVVGAPVEFVPVQPPQFPPPSSAYVYDLASGTPTTPVASLSHPDAALNDRFGTSVAISGTRVVVGATAAPIPGGGYGRAYIYDLTSGTPAVPAASLNDPSPASADNFGNSVAISGTRVVVGAYLDDTGANNSGSAYVYDLGGGTPTVPVATLSNPSPATEDRFGNSVAISGTRVVVGAYLDDTGVDYAGIAYIYDLTSGTPAVPVATLNNPSPATDDNFGWSVAIEGTSVAVGTPNALITNLGIAYIFAPADHDIDDDGLLDLWEYARFGDIGAHDADDDTDGDGQEELLELALDRNPLVPDAAAGPQVTNEGGYLTLSVAKRAGVTYLGQSAATPNGADFSAATTTVLVNDAATLKVRDNFPITGGSQRYMRVMVTSAP